MPAWKKIVEEFELPEYDRPWRWRRGVGDFINEVGSIIKIYHRGKFYPQGQRYRITIEKIDGDNGGGDGE